METQSINTDLLSINDNKRTAAASTTELTPVQRRAVMFAMQYKRDAEARQKANAEKKAEQERIKQKVEEDFLRSTSRASHRSASTAMPRVSTMTFEEEVSMSDAVGKVLRELRTEEHKSLREVSEKAGVSLGYLSEIERGQKEPSYSVLTSIGDALGMSMPQVLRLVADCIEQAA